MMIGAPIGGWAGDRFGRRKAIILSVAFFGLASFPVALSQNVAQLAVLRLVAGIGFGALLPNATAMVVEWMPSKLSSYMISLMIVGVPVGGLIGASVSSWLIAAYGWQACFVAGGGLAVGLSFLLWAFLPESPKYLVKSSPSGRAVAPLMNRAFGMGRFKNLDDYHIDEEVSGRWSDIFSTTHLKSTIGIAIAFFANLFVFYGLANWIPTILTSRGFDLSVALQCAMYFNLFGLVGAISVAAIVACISSKAGLMSALIGGIIACGTTGLVFSMNPPSLTLIMACLICAGACLVGLQVGLYSVAAKLYPTHCRSTGIGFAAGVGRLGPIISAAGGGLLLDIPGGIGWFSGVAVIALLVAVVGVLLVDGLSAPVRRGIAQ
jgi:MFS transporter, AAHS family, 4-hydroxybenzoate transporter